MAALAGGVAGLFTLDEDVLSATGHTLREYADKAAPALATAHIGAAAYTGATSGTATEAFTSHWNTLTGHNGTLINVAASAGAALTVVAGAITVAKSAVLARLGWCAAQLAAAPLTGPGGPLAATRALIITRVTNGNIITRLFRQLTDTLAPLLRRGSDALRTLLQRLGILPSANGRLRFAGGSPYGPTTKPWTLHTPKGGDRMDIGWTGGSKKAQKAAEAAAEEAKNAKTRPGIGGNVSRNDKAELAGKMIERLEGNPKDPAFKLAQESDKGTREALLKNYLKRHNELGGDN